MIQIEPTNAERRDAWLKPEMRRLDAGAAEGGGGAGIDFASEVS